MTKYIVKEESLIDKLVGAVFGSVAKQIKDLEKRKKDMEVYIKKNKTMLQKRYPDAF